jgi:hypothetical protein
MAEYLLARTARFLQCIRENGKSAAVQCASRQMPLLVGRLGETDHQSVLPDKDGTVEGDSTEEEWAADVTK